MKRLLGAVVALGLSGGVAQAQDPQWWPIEISNVATGVDVASRTRTGDTATIWVILVYQQPKADENNSDYRLSRMEFSCSRRTGLQISSSGYTVEGDYVGGSENRAATMSVAPGTILGAIFETACQRDLDVDPMEVRDTANFVRLSREIMAENPNRD